MKKNVIKSKLLTLSLILLIACNSPQEKKDIIKSTTYIAQNYSVKSLYNELIRRSYFNSDTTIPINSELAIYSNDSLYKAYRILLNEKVDYDTDDRINFYEADSLIQSQTEKVCCIIKKEQLQNNNDGTYIIKPLGILGELKGLCDYSNFYSEPVAGFCTGFAISNKLIATAGHCIKNDNDLKNCVFVFGFRMLTKLKANIRIPETDVYFGEKIFSQGNLSENSDYCIIKVSKDIPHNRIATLSNSKSVKKGQNIYAIGYPNGIPVKIAIRGTIIENSNSKYFTTNLDTYSGNSGSPVFDSITNDVEGILVRGNQDFRYIKLSNCYAPITCPETIGDCTGEQVTRITVFNKLQIIKH